jgi:hypothetical protein
MPVDDPVADALLGDSYERIRVERRVYLRYALPRKVAWQSYMLIALAAVLPIVALLPTNIRSEFVPDVTAATPKISFLALVALVLVTATGIGHLFVAWRTRRDLDERTARELFTLENVCSLLGFATGGFAVGTTHGLVLLGFGPFDAYLAIGGGNPFVSSTLAPPLGVVALAALVAGVGLRTAAAWLPKRD